MDNSTINTQDIKGIRDYVEDLFSKGIEEVIRLPRDEKFPPPTGTTGRDVPERSREEVRKSLEGLSEGDNIGFRIPKGHIGIDFDNYGSKQGWKHFEALLEADGLVIDRDEWVNALVRQSRRGPDSLAGHFFFKLPPGWEDVRFSGKACEDVDLLQHHHRYAVAAGSVVEGEMYKWYRGTEETEAPAVEDWPVLAPEIAAIFARSSRQGNRVKGDPESLNASLAWLEGRVFGGESRAELPDDVHRYDTMVSTVMSLISNAVHNGHAGLMADLERIRARREDYEVSERRAVSNDYAGAVTSAVAIVKAEIASDLKQDINWRERFGAEPFSDNYALPDFSDLIAGAAKKQAEAYREKLIGEEIAVGNTETPASEDDSEESAKREELFTAEQREAIREGLLPEDLDEFLSYARRKRIEDTYRKVEQAQDEDIFDFDSLLMTGEEIANSQPSEEPWLIERLMREGDVSMLYAGGKVGKSRFIHNVAAALANGSPLFGEYSTARPYRVHVADLELDHDKIRERGEQIEGLNDADFNFYAGKRRKFALNSRRWRVAYAAWLKSKGYEVLFLDGLQPVAQALGLDPWREMGQTVEWLREISVEAGLKHVFTIMHASNKPDGMDRGPKGDSSLIDEVDGIWRLEFTDPDKMNIHTNWTAQQFKLIVSGRLAPQEVELKLVNPFKLSVDQPASAATRETADEKNARLWWSRLRPAIIKHAQTIAQQRGGEFDPKDMANFREQAKYWPSKNRIGDLLREVSKGEIGSKRTAQKIVDELLKQGVLNSVSTSATGYGLYPTGRTPKSPGQGGFTVPLQTSGE